MQRKKISIIGAGNVGAACASWLAARGLGDLVLFDVVDGLPQGKALDISQAGPIDGHDVTVTGSNRYQDTARSDIVIIAAGLARKPGMSRENLLIHNTSIISFVSQQAARYSPEAFFIVVTDPLDVMTYVSAQVTGLPRERVMGMAGVLDSARMSAFIAEELQVSVADVQACVLGGHGETMVPLPRFSTVSGIPLTNLVNPERIAAICARTRNGGAEILSFLKTGSAFYAPAAAVGRMVEAIVNNRKRILPASVLLDGEYGISDCCFGVPVKLGGNGIEKIIELDLQPAEQVALERSYAALRVLLDQVKI